MRALSSVPYGMLGLFSLSVASGFNTPFGVANLMRAKTVPHVEYEILRHILNEVDISDVVMEMVPEGDEVAKERFDKGARSALQLLRNLMLRRLHRLPKDHPDYQEKGASA